MNAYYVSGNLLSSMRTKEMIKNIKEDIKMTEWDSILKTLCKWKGCGNEGNYFCKKFIFLSLKRIEFRQILYSKKKKKKTFQVL